MDKLPIYEVSINPELETGEELGWNETAFTANPSVIVKGMAYKSQLKKQMYADEKKYRVTAPAMIPMDIYRNDENGEYEVRFTAQEIENIFVKFMSNLKNSDLFNIEHDSEQRVPAYVLEAWLVDNPKQDKAFSTFSIEVPKGTLMLTAQVTDIDFYNEIVDKGQIGFSIEAFLALKTPKEQLNKYTMELPNGDFSLNGKNYEVLDGKVQEVALAEVEEEVNVDASEEEEVQMEKVQEEEEVVMTDPVIEEEEEVEVEAEVNPEADAEAILAIVTPLIEEKHNELLQIIAELKNELADSIEVAPIEDAEINMSAHLGFSNFVKFTQQNG
jgi:hypothetical protein